MEFKTDCRFFLGSKPCRFKRLCPECPHYDPYDCRILIIKLAAAGDVLRTTPLLTALKRRYPGAQITWVTEPHGYELLKGVEEIDRLMVADLGTYTGLAAEKFDRVYCFDKEPLATGLAAAVQAETYLGYGQNEAGALITLNEASAYAYRLGLDDELKFRGNTKTYPEIVFEMAELPYAGEEYLFSLHPSEKAKALRFADQHQLQEAPLVIGINTGCGPAFQMKKWTVENILGFIDLVSRKMKAKVLLLGGPREAERNREIMERTPHQVLDTGCDNSLREFAGFIDVCDVLVVGDTLAMHLGIALKKKILLLIGSTSWTEIDLFGRGRKLISDMACAPCYKRTCEFDPWCLQQITPDQVYEALEAVV